MSARQFPWPAPDASAPVTGDNDSHSVRITVEAVKTSMQALSAVMEAMEKPSAETRASDAFAALAAFQSLTDPTPRDRRRAMRALLSVMHKPAARALLAIANSPRWQVDLRRVVTMDDRKRATAQRHRRLAETIARLASKNGISPRQAAERVASDFHVGPERAERIYHEWARAERTKPTLHRIQEHPARFATGRAHPWMAKQNPQLSGLPSSRGRPTRKNR